MLYTQADLENVKNAILALATGERVARVTIGDKTFEFGQAQLNDLRDLRAEIQSEMQASTNKGKGRIYLSQTSKGL